MQVICPLCFQYCQQRTLIAANEPFPCVPVSSAIDTDLIFRYQVILDSQQLSKNVILDLKSIWIQIRSNMFRMLYWVYNIPSHLKLCIIALKSIRFSKMLIEELLLSQLLRYVLLNIEVVLGSSCNYEVKSLIGYVILGQAKFILMLLF